MLQFILVISTLAGGLAAIWFIYDKILTIDWRRYRFRRGTDHRSMVSSTANMTPGRASWPPAIEPNFPDDLRQAVHRHFPDYRLPKADDITLDWALYGNPKSLYPLMCRGKFIGKGIQYACFLLRSDGSGAKVVVISPESGSEPINLLERVDVPQVLFLETVKPGNYRTVKGKGYRWAAKADIPRVLRLCRDGINFGKFESADSIFYWNLKKQGFVQVHMSD